MVRFFYNLLFPFVFLFMLPRFLLRMFRRGKYRHKFGQRLGIYSERVRNRIESKSPIWVHAVSVGEVRIAMKLMQKVAQDRPGTFFVLSTTTSTGFQLASAETRADVEVIYNPIDFPPCVHSALGLINPRALVLVEAEVWPNLVYTAKKRGIPAVLVNARLSPRSYRRFHRFRSLARPIFRQLDRICLSFDRDVTTWESLGMPRERLQVTGSIKFDQSGGETRPKPEFMELLRCAGARPAAPVLLGGSTHAGEERLLAEAYLGLREEFADLFLVVVPRHFERSGKVVEDLESVGLRSVRRSMLDPSVNSASDCMIVDTTGELRNWYAVASVVFVGKSMLGRGGQNPVEPMMAGKPVLFGPHMENFQQIADSAVEAGAAIRVGTDKELRGEVARLLRDPKLGGEMAASSEGILRRHRGATERTAREILSLLPG